MEGDDVVWLVFVASLVVGFAWARISAWLALPHTLSVLFTQPLMGLLGVFLGWCSLLLDLDDTLDHLWSLATHSPLRAAIEIVEFNCSWFFGGAFFGLSGLLGWVAAYRRNHSRE